MELSDVIGRRRMVRSFTSEPVDPVVVDRLLAEALRAPSAGNTQGVSWLVLQGEETAAYWVHATTSQWRATSARFGGLSRAPVIALSLCSPRAYLERYGEEDKSGSGLGAPESAGGCEAAWPVPYWFGDAAFSTMVLLLGVADAGIGAAFLGNFRAEAALLEALGVPESWRLFGAVVIGHPDGRDHPSPSLGRPPAEGAAVVHRGRWGRR